MNDPAPRRGSRPLHPAPRRGWRPLQTFEVDQDRSRTACPAVVPRLSGGEKAYIVRWVRAMGGYNRAAHRLPFRDLYLAQFGAPSWDPSMLDCCSSGPTWVIAET